MIISKNYIRLDSRDEFDMLFEERAEGYTYKNNDSQYMPAYVKRYIDSLATFPIYLKLDYSASLSWTRDRWTYATDDELLSRRQQLAFEYEELQIILKEVDR